MKLIKKIYPEDVGLRPVPRANYLVNVITARAVVRFEDRFPILFATNHGYHGLLGGKIQSGESMEEACRREIEEEGGFKINIIQPVGMIIEFRDFAGEIRISYCYFAEAIGKPGGSINLSAREKAKGFKLKFPEYGEALRLFSEDNPNNREGRFSSKRDKLFLRHCLKI